MKNEKLTLIVPVYNEQETLDLFYNETERVLKDIDIMIEYLFIDDGSKDNSLNIRTKEYIMYPFPEILERKLLFTLVLKTQQEIILQY